MSIMACRLKQEAWGKHCEHVCHKLGVKFISLKANAQASPGQSPEEVARNARYAALKPLLAEDDVLLVAQHAEDQLETVLLQLFRGSGLKGLSGMPLSMAFGKGKLLRPLLDVPKAEIIAYSKAHDLQWVEDPSNQSTDFNRNFLRNDIIPLLKQRWPSLDKTVSRSAAHCANAQELLASLADDGLTAVMNPDDSTLAISRLQSYPSLQQALLIRHWFHHLGLKMPSLGVVERILAEVIAAREDAEPMLVTQGCTLRRYRDALYCLKPLPEQALGDLIWRSNEALLKLADDRIYEAVPAQGGIALRQWQVAEITVGFRSGGETLSLPGRSGHHSLKKLYQEAGIPPWERDVMPLFYLDGKLAAVGEYWIDAEVYSDQDEACIRIIRHKINPKGHDDAPDVD